MSIRALAALTVALTLTATPTCAVPTPPPAATAPVAAHVRGLIEVRGLKKKALASALGITESQACSRISGRVAFEVDELPAVAQFLGCDLQDLLRSEAA